ncbi:hypothetical protein Dsin_028120 [Dipteronia sinensis]|uniref:Serine-threonine/tyrosine-protein kinase catalytic domain-containing protein n=1 Tax=Dipteronia sinensis TaxID=43782 RepID=A0AAE0DU98_9ROSI|nr:hypothetical protein Dsin_028120 [Dipteronia sinensis]
MLLKLLILKVASIYDLNPEIKIFVVFGGGLTVWSTSLGVILSKFTFGEGNCVADYLANIGWVSIDTLGGILSTESNSRLARMHYHEQLATAFQVIGTAGYYMALEVVRTGRALTQTDVFGFGVLVLEVVCGRRPIEDGTKLALLVMYADRERGGNCFLPLIK